MTAFQIKLIRNEDQYDEALGRVQLLMRLAPSLGSPEGDEIEVLVTLIEAFEAVHYSMRASDPIAYLKHKMEQKGLKPADLIPFIGDKTQVSKILNGKRDLTLPMIKRLAAGLQFPVERLLGGEILEPKKAAVPSASGNKKRKLLLGEAA